MQCLRTNVYYDLLLKLLFDSEFETIRDSNLKMSTNMFFFKIAHERKVSKASIILNFLLTGIKQGGTRETLVGQEFLLNMFFWAFSSK